MEEEEEEEGGEGLGGGGRFGVLGLGSERSSRCSGTEYAFQRDCEMKSEERERERGVTVFGMN